MESTLEQLIKQNRSLPLAPSVIGAFANPTAGSSLSDPLNTQRYIQYLTMPLTHQMNPDFAALCPSVHPVQTRASPTLMQRRKLNENQRFVLFTKILFRLLEQSSPQLVRQVKALVAHCSRRNRMGDPNYAPLQDAVESRLRYIVGDDFYFAVKLYCDQQCRKKGLSQITIA